MANPFTWIGVVETESSFHIFSVNALDANGAPEDLATFEKPQPSPALAAAMNTQGGKVMLDFARFPWAQVDGSEDGYQVSLCDLRFFNPSAHSRGFTLDVELDKNLQTRSENFFFTVPPRK
jgi:hypothetical protein